jgi:hypothetical protein
LCTMTADVRPKFEYAKAGDRSARLSCTVRFADEVAFCPIRHQALATARGALARGGPRHHRRGGYRARSPAPPGAVGHRRPHLRGARPATQGRAAREPGAAQSQEPQPDLQASVPTRC